MAHYQSDQLTVLAGKIKDVKYGMFTTVDSAHVMTSRPLTSQQVDAQGQMWFFVSDEATYLNDLLTQPQVNVSFADTSANLYVSVSGRASTVRDRAKAEELWNPMTKAFFPAGLDDPHLLLLKVDIDVAEYWDTPAGKMVQMFEIAKAALTGTPPKNLAEHGEIRL